MKIYIEVSGGLVQNVYAVGEEDVDVIVADYDADGFWDDEYEAEHEENLREFERVTADPNCRHVW